MFHWFVVVTRLFSLHVSHEHGFLLICGGGWRLGDVQRGCGAAERAQGFPLVGGESFFCEDVCNLKTVLMY